MKNSNVYITKILVLAFIICGIFFFNSATQSKAYTKTVEGRKEVSGTDCVKIADTSYDCTDRDTKLKASYAVWGAQKGTTIKAYVTRYSKLDSCHYPKDGGCLTASGQLAKPDMAVACPRSLKLGTIISINGKLYTCNDRYATWLDQKRDLPTFDIYTSSYAEAKTFGIQKSDVTIL